MKRIQAQKQYFGKRLRSWLNHTVKIQKLCPATPNQQRRETFASISVSNTNNPLTITACKYSSLYSTLSLISPFDHCQNTTKRFLTKFAFSTAARRWKYSHNREKPTTYPTCQWCFTFWPISQVLEHSDARKFNARHWGSEPEDPTRIGAHSCFAVLDSYLVACTKASFVPLGRVDRKLPQILVCSLCLSASLATGAPFFMRQDYNLHDLSMRSDLGVFDRFLVRWPWPRLSPIISMINAGVLDIFAIRR